MIALRPHRVNGRPVSSRFCVRLPSHFRLFLRQDDRYDAYPLVGQDMFSMLTSHTYALKCVVSAYIAHWGDSLKPATLRSRVTF